MTTFTGPIRRVDTAKSHHYVDAHNRRVPGVTTILSGGLPKPALVNWAGNATAGYAIDHWDELGALPPSERLKKLQGARYEDRDTAANRGTEVHALADRLVRGEEVEVPDELAGHVESYVAFLDDHDPQPLLVESTVYSLKHGHAGTLDVILDFPHGLPGFAQPQPRILADVKTNRSGVFGDTAFQLAGYRYSEFIYDDSLGEPQPMLAVDGVAVIHVRGDGYDLVPLVAGPQQYRDFLYIAEVRRAAEASRDLVGAPITPPSRTPRRRLELAPQEAAA